MINILKREYKKVIFIALGSLISAVGVVWFLSPAGLYSGGVTGIAQLIVNGSKEIYDISINLGLLIFILNIPIVIFGFKKMTKKFVYYSIYSIILQSLFIGLLPLNVLLENDMISNALVGGSLIGIGMGINLRVGGSSGGMDIIFQYLSFKKDMTVGSLGMSLNLVIITIAGISFGWTIAIYTIVRIIITNLVVDKVHTSYNFIKLEIVTEYGKKVADMIVSHSKHGVTIEKGTGAYSKRDKDILSVIISAFELNKFIKLIKEIDQEAFIAVSTVKKVVGNFKKLFID